MAHSYALAKDSLSEAEKNRLVCLFLSCDQKTVDWQKATADFGAASVDSMRVCTRAILKKLVADTNGDGAQAATPKTPKAPKTPKKRGRKSAAAADDEDDGGEGADGTAKSAKKRTKKDDEEEKAQGEGDCSIKEHDEEF